LKTVVFARDEEYARRVDIAELRREKQEHERWLASLTPEANLRSAALLREVMPKLATVRQRELAEEMAGKFEEGALAQPRFE
jgi:hypothetical protein